ncbi:rhamnan synthesis F family protein [Streptococcus lutetiensis]|uniref:rhamnan synthesis F family protein n=1 Tax=Streptococcus lutetiensis TaxID=150055 RepID=UPI001BDA1F10|nr:rhamnan synthesis F family protein [Streptococcus lutetiensis]MBT0889935.1 glycosyltransferase [Streptococcus lutetiensis]MBT0914834.1 glycosyltransferase [Streptococcus lutetiensis]MBT0916524.1 glycosyltransferase [Streptococcus lutetiensis]MBT0919939.1 glycosyltransferase [Streptococcus lutetiensis]MBT0921624.1 glycosyltransferase [Streptococcus lutetiensis]
MKMRNISKTQLLVKMKAVLRKIAQVLKKIVRFGKKAILKLKCHILRVFRDNFRDNNYLPRAKRILIYNIFEGKDALQEYKIIFLEALAKIVDEAHIVVNGELSQSDVERLEKIGKVTLRENKGYDVAAFRAEILNLGQERLKEYDQLLLVNDTNIGPFKDLETVFSTIDSKSLDFWGVSLGEIQPDFTGLNPFGYIPEHIQTYFLVIERSLLHQKSFYRYWEKLGDTDSRQKAIGKHETFFTKHFANLGFRYDALIRDTTDSAMYIHPLRVLNQGSPLIKYSALSNYNDDQFIWQGLERQSEIPELISYIEEKTDYPVEIITDIIDDFKKKSEKKYVLIIDGVENIIPQCTRYRILNKAEQLEKLGYDVKVVNLSKLQLLDCKGASHIIIYRAPDLPILSQVCQLANKTGVPVFYDIDDLVFDTKYTDQLAYTQGLSTADKNNYDESVRGYGRMLNKCDAVITSTNQLAKELRNYKSTVILNRNVLSQELVEISQKTPHMELDDNKVRMGYFSGSITHNENFEMIKPAIISLLKEYKNLELHLAGHLDIPEDIACFGEQIVTHPYVDWRELPKLISSIDINLAPLVQSTFNEAKSEIKWLEAAAVKVPTVASKIGSFEDMIEDGIDGVLASETEWKEKLERLIVDKDFRIQIAENAYQSVMTNSTTSAIKKNFLEG